MAGPQRGFTPAPSGAHRGPDCRERAKSANRVRPPVAPTPRYRTIPIALSVTNTEKKATEAQQRYDAAIIDRAIQDAALNNGVLPEAISDALFRARQFGWQLNEKGEVIAKAPNGDIRYGADATTTLRPKDWVTGTLKQEAKHLFKGHVGGGATGSGTDKTDPGYNPWKKETWMRRSRPRPHSGTAGRSDTARHGGVATNQTRTNSAFRQRDRD